MSEESTTRVTVTSPVRVEGGAGILWLIGWMFTIAFAQLGLGKAFLAILIWPWYLGVAVR